MKNFLSISTIAMLTLGVALIYKTENTFNITSKVFSSSETKISQNALETKNEKDENIHSSNQTEEPAKLEENTEAELCQTSESMLAIIEDERNFLNVRKQEIENDLAKLELAKERVEIELDNLRELRQEVNGLLEKTEKLYTDDVERLITLYKTMKPKAAAEIMNEIDPEVAVMVLGTMPERNAAPILANMTPTRARAISKIILERSKLPGDQKLNNIKMNP